MATQFLEDEFVQVLVPKRFVTRVYGFIAALDAEPGDDADSEHVSHLVASTIDPYNGWTEAEIRTQFRQSQYTMRKFQQVLAENPDVEFTSADLAEALGLPYGWNSIAGALGAYKRRVRNRYNHEQYPFSITWDEDDHAHYSMSPQVAEIIQSMA